MSAHLTCAVPDGWQQGRGAWGGLLVTESVRAVRTQTDRPVRSLSMQMLAPVPAGDVDVEVEELRSGSATSSYAVRFVSDVVMAHAVVVTGDARVPELDTSWLELTPPQAPGWRDCPEVPIGPPLGPVFASNLRWRPVSGFPTAGKADDTIGWIHPGDVGGYDDAVLLGLVDAWWPATLVRLDRMRPVATIAFEASLLGDPAALDPDEPVLHRGRVLAGREGYVVESRELWSSEGDLLVHNVQTLVVIA